MRGALLKGFQPWQVTVKQLTRIALPCKGFLHTMQGNTLISMQYTMEEQEQLVEYVKKTIDVSCKLKDSSL